MRRVVILLLGLALAVAALIVLFDRERAVAVMRQEDIGQTRVFAYRGWQSVGVRLNEGDEVEISAGGEWLYTPGEIHGPEGHARYPAPTFYPLTDAPGGVLIGRIGEKGSPFLVGGRTWREAQQSGALYLRINDDMLGDNWGWVEVDIDVHPAED